MSEEQKEVVMPYRVVISLLQLQVAFKDLLLTGNTELAMVGADQSMSTLSRLVEDWAKERIKQQGIIPTTKEIQREVKTLMNRRYAPFLKKQHGDNEKGPSEKKEKLGP